MPITLAGLLFGPSVDVVYRSMTSAFRNPHLIAKSTRLDVGIVRFALYDLLSVGLVEARSTNGGEYAAVRDDDAFINRAVADKAAAARVKQRLRGK